MFPTLRAKLTVAFALVTFLTVFLSALGIVLLLRDREESAARERIGQFGNAVAGEVLSLAGANWRADALSVFLQQRAEELNLRFLLIDRRGLIVTDTAGKLTSQPADDIIRADRGMRRSDLSGFGFATWQEGPVRQMIFFPGVTPASRRQGITPDYQVVMLVPEANISGAWEGLLPRVALSGTIALVAAIGVAYVLSRSITRPVVEVTRASEQMARGRYDQRIPVSGRDEIGRLARVFNKMAHEVARTHQAMRDLNGNVAHELKTPLTSIQGYAQALLDGAVRSPEEAEHAARVIHEEAERMRRLVDDLLYLSRLESGQLQLECAPVHVPTLLQTAAERVAWQAQEGGRELRLLMGIDIPIIQGDARRLEQVLANLLDNALRHTPPGGRITLGARWSLEHVTLSVHNTGSYIPPEHLPRIFERFYQVDPARTREGRLRTSGLGLAIAREIVAAHGGRISAGSDPDTGTEFTVVLSTSVSRAPDDPAQLPLPTPTALPAGRPAPPTPLPKGKGA